MVRAKAEESREAFVYISPASLSKKTPLKESDQPTKKANKRRKVKKK
jgi:hypothetical protein